ncbi:putative bifunctional diguanylate cyclase/phosphodiesterase [Hyphomonas pacifica]|uniref:Diguanylate cyclase n=1 Tax=Hyphomonas pacifica TaxID=1280941 RepID=A0A062TZR6_9PROT|nr:EAL domain-containing protein [Hyphomonas pacifica]KCZ48707.1 hypothetical protein HY2_15900 [Hyphomonas pacifica]RAN31599.1 hypothetical protein HY3_16310 [Hyphomonas pacifica]RAN33294.1 hypothetical protein HY11_16935 [Hyphomonas pacifica]
MDSKIDLKAYRTMLRKARTSDEAVAVEQLRAIAQNVPPLYTMLSVAAMSLGLTFLDIGPLHLTIGVPALFIVVSVLRIGWWTHEKVENYTYEAVRRGLLSMEWLSYLLIISLSCWVGLLLPYADDTHAAYLAFFTAFTGSSATICAMPRPRLVVGALLATFGAFCLLFLPRGTSFYVFMAVHLATTFFVFFMFSYIYKKRIEQTVMLHNELVSENERASGLAESNRYLALSDTLTGLPNRRRFFEQISVFFERSPNGQLPVVGLVDLDGFKPINDVYGHSAGDSVLIETAARLQSLIADHNGGIARLGGDEFAYVLPWNTTPEQAKEFAESILKVMERPFMLPCGNISRVSASIGYSSRDFDVDSAKDLMEQADFALFRAKETVDKSIVRFSAIHAASKRREVLVHQAFKNANLDDEIHLVFQPIVNSTDGTMNCCEALARWDSPEIGMVPPGEFVPIAEKAGMTQEMTMAVFRKVIDQMKVWPDSARVSVNLSAQDVNSEQCTDAVAALLMVQPASLRRRISIEVTESSLLTDFELVRANLFKFRELGVKIALDDFGTGYSSLRYLQEIEFDVVKIDRSFVRSIEENGKSFGLVRTIQQLCRSLSVTCIVEGVESREQLEYARSAGCVFVQGYYYSQPLMADKLVPYLLHEESFEDYRQSLGLKTIGVAS